MSKCMFLAVAAMGVAAFVLPPDALLAQMVDRTRAPSSANEGIAKTLAQPVGPIAAIG
jgi:hypothetical protein